MSFFIGYILGSVITLALIYHAGKKKKAELEKASSAQCLNNKNTDKGDEEDF